MSSLTSRQKLLEQRANIVTQMRTIADTADTADGSGLTTEQASAFDALKVALANLEAAISARAAVDDAERRTAGTPIANGPAGNDARWEAEARGFSIVRAIAAASGIPGIDAGREREISAEVARRSGRQFQGIAVPYEALMRVERRVVTTTTPTGLAGGNVIGTFLDGSQFIDPLRSQLVIRQLGARVLDGLTSNVDIPRLALPSAAGWFMENSPMMISDPGFDRVSLRPRHAGGIVELSRNVLIQSSPAIEDIIRSDLASVLARVIDAAAINGTGTANDPVGLLAYPGVPVIPIGANGGPITWAAVNALIATVSQANAATEGRAFLTNARVVASMMQVPKLAGVALGFIADSFGELAGYPMSVTSLVPANGSKGSGSNLSSLAFGAWSDCLIGVWGDGIELMVNPYAETVFTKANVQVRAVVTCDVEFRHPQSFAVCTDVSAP